MLKDESLTELQLRVLQDGPASLADAYVLGALHQRYLHDRAVVLTVQKHRHPHSRSAMERTSIGRIP